FSLVSYAQEFLSRGCTTVRSAGCGWDPPPRPPSGRDGTAAGRLWPRGTTEVRGRRPERFRSAVSPVGRAGRVRDAGVEHMIVSKPALPIEDKRFGRS